MPGKGLATKCSLRIGALLFNLPLDEACFQMSITQASSWLLQEKMSMFKYTLLPLGFFVFLVAQARIDAVDDERWIDLFTEDGVPKGWLVRRWDDVAKPVDDAGWTVKDRLLHSGQRRGTWLMSEKEYGNFVLEFEI